MLSEGADDSRSLSSDNKEHKYMRGNMADKRKV